MARQAVFLWTGVSGYKYDFSVKTVFIVKNEITTSKLLYITYFISAHLSFPHLFVMYR